MTNNKATLSINTAVLEKMAELAAKDVPGVAGLSKKAIDFKSAVKTRSPFKGIKVESVNGAVKINVYICVKSDAKVKEVAEAVQAGVKEKVQTMTGAAVTKVNVIVADVEFEPDDIK